MKLDCFTTIQLSCNYFWKLFGKHPEGEKVPRTVINRKEHKKQSVKELEQKVTIN